MAKDEKENIHKEQLDVQKKILAVSEKHLNVGTEHKEISKSQAKESMSLTEQRIWWMASILVVILLSGAIYSGLFHNSEKVNDIRIDVSPAKIKLNEKNNIQFQLNFTNVGKRDISEFDILKADLYRMEDEKAVYLRNLIVPGYPRNFEISCDTWDYQGNSGNLPVGKKCYVKFLMIGCPECFDDKDKTPMIYIYMHSIPPIENRIVNLSIY
jgi:hypothetical protein